MIWLVVALIILFILIVVIIWTKLTIILDYYHGNDNDHLKVEVKIWFGLIKYKKEIPMIKIDDNTPSIVFKEKTKVGQDEKTSSEGVTQIKKDDIRRIFRNARKLLQHVVKLHAISRDFLSKVSVKQFEWHSVIGVGDAAYTGMFTGAVWAIKGSMVGMISHYMKLKEMPKMTVMPNFQKAVSQTRLKCIFQFRIGQAMLAGLKLIKFWKGGLPNFESKKQTVLSKEQG
ncbi:DUF2953 domain-containing protein [Bacillus sp. CGMCC 1.16607]|uniref:DUF2953 domain-containing protein n=1 Tax=Bacillus sp. CGMCC 1.16607 TaxID=3351842 RepID=UPI003625C3B1